MARIRRKAIKFTEESLNELFQEVYNDTHNYKAELKAILAKWNPYIKDEGHVAAIGKEVVNLMNALARTNDQKIVLVKVLKDIIFAKKNNGEGQASSSGSEQETLSDEAKNSLMMWVEEEARKKFENTGS